MHIYLFKFQKQNPRIGLNNSLELIWESAKGNTWLLKKKIKNSLVNNSSQNIMLPGARVVAQLVHVWVVLGHNGDGVTLLADDETSLLLCSIPQIDTIILVKKKFLLVGLRADIKNQKRTTKLKCSSLLKL